MRSRCRSIATPFWRTSRPVFHGRGNATLLASVGPQILYLAIHLVQGLAELGLQPSPAMVGEVPPQPPRFLEEHASVLELRFGAPIPETPPSADLLPVPVRRSPKHSTSNQVSSELLLATLLLEKDLLTAQQDSEVVTLARARTLTVLERLDPS